MSSLQYQRAVKKRAPNFTAEEKLLLLQMCEVDTIIIENKKTDSVSVREKNAVWEKITNNFNANSLLCQRTPSQLRTLYDNIKQDAKKKYLEEQVSVITII